MFKFIGPLGERVSEPTVDLSTSHEQLVKSQTSKAYRVLCNDIHERSSEGTSKPKVFNRMHSFLCRMEQIR